MHIAIIGNGICGITAARYIRILSDHKITVISGETDHFYSRTALMYIYMGHLSYKDTKPYEDWFWDKNRINLIRDHVDQLETDRQILHLRKGDPLKYDRLVLATGSHSNFPHWHGNDLRGVQALYGIPDLENMEKYTQDTKNALVVGGGLIGIEMAEMLHSRGIPVTCLVRESGFYNRILPREESEMINREIRKHHIDLRLNTELKKLHPGENGRVQAAETKQGEKIPCQFAGITVGVHPNLDLVKNTPVRTNKGILVNDHLETNIAGIYAGGDCAEWENPQPGRKPIEPIWYTGKIMGETIARNICGESTPYRPGVFYNSAKFFTVEYQVYGTINTQLAPDEATLYWEHPSEHKSIRINYDKNTGQVKGFNLMGIRYRHLTCSRWIKEGAHIEKILEMLPEANFDPEFTRQYESQVIEKYNTQNPGKNLVVKRKKGLPGILSFKWLKIASP